MPTGRWPGEPWPRTHLRTGDPRGARLPASPRELVRSHVAHDAARDAVVGSTRAKRALYPGVISPEGRLGRLATLALAFLAEALLAKVGGRAI
jgi:hypothetical protein